MDWMITMNGLKIEQSQFSSKPNADYQSNQLSPVGYRVMPSPPATLESIASIASASASESAPISKKKAAPRPIPNLIPIASVSNISPTGSDKSSSLPPTILKIPQIHKRLLESSDEADPTDSPHPGYYYHYSFMSWVQSPCKKKQTQNKPERNHLTWLVSITSSWLMNCNSSLLLTCSDLTLSRSTRSQLLINELMIYFFYWKTIQESVEIFD